MEIPQRHHRQEVDNEHILNSAAAGILVVATFKAVNFTKVVMVAAILRKKRLVVLVFKKSG